MKTMKRITQSLRTAIPRKVSERLIIAVMLGAMLVCLLTSCGGSNQAVASVSKGEIKPVNTSSVANGLTEEDLTALNTLIQNYKTQETQADAAPLRGELKEILKTEVKTNAEVAGMVEDAVKALSAAGITLTEEQAAAITAGDVYTLANWTEDSLAKEEGTLDKLATEISTFKYKENKREVTALLVREGLVAALRGYDLYEKLTNASFVEPTGELVYNTANSVEYAKKIIQLLSLFFVIKYTL